MHIRRTKIHICAHIAETVKLKHIEKIHDTHILLKHNKILNHALRVGVFRLIFLKLQQTSF